MKKFKNNKQETDTWCGMMIESGSYYEIDAQELYRWQNDSKVLSDIGSGDLIVNNGTSDILDVATAINFLKVNQVEISNQPLQSAFASKKVGTKSLYKRVHGMQAEVAQGSNVILYTIPYAWVKMTGLQLVNSEALDVISLYVLDSVAGTYSTVPNYMLNQFGFTVNCPKDFYKNHSEFDADLYAGMQIKVVYTSLTAKTIGINFILNEVK